MDIPFADSLLDYWMRRSVRRRPVADMSTLDLARVRRVLLVLTTGLGDAILSTPVFEAVRKGIPGARVALFVRSAWAPLFSAETDLDEVIPYHGKWRRFVTTVRRLRHFAPDLALVLHGNDPDILPLAYLAGSSHIVRVPTTGTRYGWLLSNAGRPADRATIPGWHYIDNRLRVLDTIGIPATRRTPVIQVDATERTRASDWIRERIGCQDYLVVHPWAADSYKVWPQGNAQAFLSDFLGQYPTMAVVVSGSANERSAAERLVSRLPAGRAAVAAGRFGVAGTAGLVAGACAVVATDTGLLHMAAAAGVPTVGLYSPTRPALVGARSERARTVALEQPLTCDPCLEKRCPYPAARCMAQFGSDDVLAALAAILKEVV